MTHTDLVHLSKVPSVTDNPASSGFLRRVEFESSSSKKFEYRVEYRVAILLPIAVVGSVILDVIIISDIAVILSRLDWILK